MHYCLGEEKLLVYYFYGDFFNYSQKIGGTTFFGLDK